MLVNLTWSEHEITGGFAANASADRVQLGLRCLYELSDGTRGVVPAFGNSFGSMDRPPYILLDGDDRSDANAAGETMHVNLTRSEQFRRVLVFAMICRGAPNWAAVDGVVTLVPTSGPQVEIRLNPAENEAGICAVALIESDGYTVSIQREVEHVAGSQADLDEMYGWGMQWVPAAQSAASRRSGDPVFPTAQR